MMTYLICKSKNQSTDWAEKIAAGSKMWLTPGPYLRRSMLRLLAKECGAQYLPEEFYMKQTFDEDKISANEETGMARDLRDKMMVLKSADEDSEDEEEED
jgi:hypothetical protein